MNCKAAILVMIAMAGLGFTVQGASKFDAVSIKPSEPGHPRMDCNTLAGGRFVCHNAKVEYFLRLAFGTTTIQGAPAWMEELYDLDATAEGEGEMTEAELAPYMLALLRDRFGLESHKETIQQTVYRLERQKSGAKLKPSAPGTVYSVTRTEESVLLKGETMEEFARLLARRPDVQAPVIDHTGLSGKFDFAFPYVNTGGDAPAAVTPEVATRTSAAYSSTEDALDALGLRLKKEKRKVTVLVIDRIHRPMAN